MKRRLVCILACLCACSTDDPQAANDDGGLGSSTGAGSGPSGGDDADTSAGPSAGNAETTDGGGTSTGGNDETSVGETSAATSDTTTGGAETGSDETGDGTGTSGTSGTGGDDSAALHVAAFGLDSNPGTPDAPMRTIQWAISEAQAAPEITVIRVAGGTYQADVANDASVVMVEGVSLLGGWDEEFETRDRQSWPSQIVDSSAVAPGTSMSNPARVVEVPEGLTQDTRLDGFSVQIGRGQYRAAIYVEGDATISGNTFDRNADPNAVVATGIFVVDGAPRLSRNHIDLDYEGTTSQLHGITVVSGAPFIDNNVLTLTGATYSHYGINLNTASPDIVGNSVEVHDGTNVNLIRLGGSSQPRIDNNVLQAESGSSLCISSLTAGAIPVELHNNLLQCHFAMWGNGSSPIGSWESIAQVHGGVAGASGNVKLPGAVVDAADGLMLDAATPCSVARGGLDLTAEVPEDFDGAARTLPVSMGAREWDGECL